MYNYSYYSAVELSYHVTTLPRCYALLAVKPSPHPPYEGELTAQGNFTTIIRLHVLPPQAAQAGLHLQFMHVNMCSYRLRVQQDEAIQCSRSSEGVPYWTENGAKSMMKYKVTAV